jgi:hypothetical protein
MKSTLHRRGYKGRVKSLFVEMLEMDARENAGYEDIRIWSAPSECGDDVRRQADRERVEFEKEIGMTMEQLRKKFQLQYHLTGEQLRRIEDRLSCNLHAKHSIYGRG